MFRLMNFTEAIVYAYLACPVTRCLSMDFAWNFFLVGLIINNPSDMLSFFSSRPTAIVNPIIIYFIQFEGFIP